MSNAFADTWFMTQRHFRNLFRQPAWILISLVQPVVWLLLYGALFRRIVEIPGFGAGSYIDFLTPGIVVMTCLFSAGWSGMGLIDDIDRGVVDRFLVSPASRGSLIAGRLVQGARRRRHPVGDHHRPRADRRGRVPGRHRRHRGAHGLRPCCSVPASAR